MILRRTDPDGARNPYRRPVLLARNLGLGLLLTSLAVLTVSHAPQAEPTTTSCATPTCR
ncbi:hypothetical protein [Nocardioides deserti]|uniref:Uncharacterized protein n=1 Tax=Nocardioides deserti TaxID=1588644 RepID=A0ABR6U5M8_9ACTN|nr:hypothetical protein [Nocardioides deserti]MBC2959683.1 hypothetical protein [Nocardioides deserti]